jgi:single-strand DNA-binding protein
MSARSLNKVMLIGNLTRDPELRYTPQGSAVCSFGVATNREWNVDGQKKEAADFHNVVAWGKLGELCGQLLVKGTKVYVEGRLQTREWTNDNSEKRYKTEVVIDEMIILTNKRDGASSDANFEEFSNGDANQGGSAMVEDADIDKILDQFGSEE